LRFYLFSTPLNGTFMLKSNVEKAQKKYPILNLDVLDEKNTWWVVWEYIFSGKLRQPTDTLES